MKLSPVGLEQVGIVHGATVLERNSDAPGMFFTGLVGRVSVLIVRARTPAIIDLPRSIGHRGSGISGGHNAVCSRGFASEPA